MRQYELLYCLSLKVQKGENAYDQERRGILLDLVNSILASTWTQFPFLSLDAPTPKMRVNRLFVGQCGIKRKDEANETLEPLGLCGPPGS